MRSLLLVIAFSALPFSIYAQTATMENKANLLSPTLDEISGMILWGDKLYGHLDSGNGAVLFEIDSTSGAITKTITVGGATNVDWEDITQDDTYIYIGDFGNNASGSRTDLKFYRIPKQAITDIIGPTGTIPSNQVEIINFTYQDQTNFAATPANKTAFDCEAVIIDNGKLHLFTKNWVTDYTVHYTLPATPTGTGKRYIAQRVDSLKTNGVLITSATKTNDKVVVFIGYDDQAEAGFNTSGWVWLVTGFTSMDNIFTTATQKQRIVLGSVSLVGQIEGVTATSQTRVFVSNERLTVSPFLDILPKLYSLKISGFISTSLLPDGISNFVSKATGNTIVLNWNYGDAGANAFEIQSSFTGNNNDFKTIGKVNATGIIPYTYSFSDNNTPSSGKIFYRIKVIVPDGRALFSNILFVKINDNSGISFAAFPSPFTDNITVNFNNTLNQQLDITITDTYGRTVLTRNMKATHGNYSVLLNGLRHLSKGMYFITCRAGDRLFAKKILKQ